MIFPGGSGSLYQVTQIRVWLRDVLIKDEMRLEKPALRAAERD
jgi:hypothetical protein